MPKPWAKSASPYLRAAAFIWCLILIALLGSGAFTKARPGNFIWVPTLDIFGASFAISRINLGLGGSLAYPEVVQKMLSFFSQSTNPLTFDPAYTVPRIQQPDVVDQAIKAAAAMTRNDVKPRVAEDGGYVVFYGEDIGYADFYELAFRIFGFSAFATHYLYIAILTVSFLLFVFTQWRSNISIALGAIMVDGIFLASNSNIISPLVPTVASNRFLTTLALVPMLHLVITALDRRPLTLGRFFACLAQVVIMALSMRARSSGTWTILAFFGAAAVLVILRWPTLIRDIFRYLRTAFNERILSIRINKHHLVFGPVVIALGVTGMLSLTRAIQEARLDRVYFSDGVAPHHVRWHSAYLALALHPQWRLYKPYDEQSDQLADQLAWDYYLRYAEQRNLPQVSRLTAGTYPGGLTPIRLHKTAIRHGFFEFAFNNPRYMLELFGYYKPRHWITVHQALLTSIPSIAYLMFLPLLVFAYFLFKGAWATPEHSYIDRRELYVVLLVVWCFSLLPSVFAYPTLLAFADHFCASLLLLSAAMAGLVTILGLARNGDAGRLHLIDAGTVDTARGTPSPWKVPVAYQNRVQVHKGDPIILLPQLVDRLEAIDMFVHAPGSAHGRAVSELTEVRRKLSPGAIVAVIGATGAEVIRNFAMQEGVPALDFNHSLGVAFF